MLDMSLTPYTTEPVPHFFVSDHIHIKKIQACIWKLSEQYFPVQPGNSRIEEMPTTGTIEEFRRDFETALAREQNFQAPGNISVTIKELWCRDFKEYHGKLPKQSRVQLTALILLYCLSSARTGEFMANCKALGADAFGKEFAVLGSQCGFEQNITVHACRRWALMETAKAEFEFQDCEDILALDKELAELSTQLENTDSAESMREIQLQQQRIQGQKDKLYLGEPKRQYQLQPDNQSRSIHEHMLFYYYQQVMPERDLLADILPARQRYRAWLNWMLSKH
ncbi:predicted protein [Aspergillus nidulans FGSC A4]|uniref:Uncharacterized protein n=1 Tax=Emericella nidulans (strain FGSC A4 / ATCC 38163 / CBS 112.46 / NRRL 194 / M139) TaxID=227321 RepID=Q5AX58_EMENI|nr:hypothetical protein [Aspergillus nidulans FGSC A4]EAA61327.1 predicted protein [Aspergillus nidulans FGSC A4]CBF79037.1 TPA: conserved hypothetical protein [Aspergillus nidulans FGSC A4]|eukprot:XP_664726.1 predicted protein [Aspergillus nidulans FGSC A4]